MKKQILSLLLSAAVCAGAVADNGMKKFEFSEETAAVKAGTVISGEVTFESEEGFVLTGWNAWVLRKNAAPEFFAKPGLVIRKHKTAHDYDTVDIVKFTTLPQHEASGKFPFRINTAGMAAGDYAIVIQGRFATKGKAFYPGKTFYLTITEGDDKTFAPTVQPVIRKAAASPSWCKKIAVTPNPVKVKAGEKLSFQCDYAALPGESFGGHVVLLHRKDAPAGFFDRPGLAIRKHPTASGYDSTILVPFVHHASVPEAKFGFALDTTGWPAGEYDIHLQIRVVKADGKTSYPVYPVAVTVE